MESNILSSSEKKEVTIPSPCEELSEAEFEHYCNIYCPRVGSDGNYNLSVPKKEVLILNWDIVTIMYRI